MIAAVAALAVTGLGLAMLAARPSSAPTSPSARAPVPTNDAGVGEPCAKGGPPPSTYRHVVLLLEENRTWTGGRTPGVGMGFSPTTMPFLHGLASQCSYYRAWSETDGTQNSLNQYIGLTSGVANPSTVDDCTPSAACQSTDDNIFRQVRRAGGTARTFVDGASEPCSAGRNKEKHIPALYYRGGSDAASCATEVRPLADLDPAHLPMFAFIVPDQCHDGHDCGDDVVDSWAQQVLDPILAGSEYLAGNTLVVVVYDEDRPVPNLLIAPTANRPAIGSVAGSHASLLRTVEEVLGLPVLSQGQLLTAVSLRSSAHI